MKTFRIFSFLFIVASSLLLVNCTTDPIPGEDGKDGMDGADGASGTAECAACHNVTTSEAVHSSYLFSGHSNDGFALGYAGKRFDCAQCHSNEGYIDYMEFGAATDYENVTPIGCTGCHNKHTSFDFENDGYDYALRGLAPVTLFADPDGYTIDYGKDEITSHTCVICHQPREKFENKILGNGKVEVDSRFGPHYGAQSVMLEGIQGAELDGYEYNGANKSARHRSGSSCTNCHMGDSGGNNVGEHTWIWTETSCTSCHSNGTPSNKFLEEDYKTLEDLLLAEGILKIDDEGDIKIVAGEYDLVPASALWNYRMIYYDHSNGVHNPEYAKSLVRNSIEALNGN